MWTTRAKSLQALQAELAPQEHALASSFRVLDECLHRFSAKMGTSEFHRGCGLVTAKARHLGQAQYSLALDGLAQEAGALMRPLIECFELLRYFEEAPARVKEAVEGRVPSAGKIAKAIAGPFQGTREYLNKHASHFSFSRYALGHIVDIPGGELRGTPIFTMGTLRSNLILLQTILVLICITTVNCLQKSEPGSADDLVEVVANLRQEGIAATMELQEQVNSNQALA